MKNTIIIFLLCIVKISYCGPDIPNVTCPSIFRYTYDGTTYSGLITLDAPSPTANVIYVNASFSVPGSIPLNIDGTLPDSVNLKLDDYEETLNKIQTGQPLKFKVSFPRSKYLPQVTNIKYDGVDLCFGPAVAPPSAWFSLSYQYSWSGLSNYRPSLNTIPTRPTWYQPPVTKAPTSPTRPTWYQPPATTPPVFTSATRIVTPKPNPSRRPSITIKFRNDRDCGVIRPKRSLRKGDFDTRIVNGTEIPVNYHPWLAALYDNGKFFCGGNLISSKHVLTAAHCTLPKRHITIEVRLGVRNIGSLFDVGAQHKMATQVMEHPDYDGNAHADMALLVLNEDVVFTSAIKPICLWNHDSNFRLIVHYIGTIMGWGTTEHGRPSNLPLKTDVTIATKDDCRKIDILKNYVTDETFCAGGINSGPCMGDSGGGLFLRFDNKWYLRGIISTALSYKNSETCDTNSYAIYVDTAKYLDWIVQNMEYK